MRTCALLLVIGAAGACAGDRASTTPGAPAGATHATDPDPAAVPPGVDDLSRELEAQRVARKLPALGAAVWRAGELVAIGAVGLRKADDPTSHVALTDRWHLGSNTKAMTATLIGLHIDRGALRWDDTLGHLFSGEKVDAGYASVTLEQLMRHVGGAPGNPPHDLWERLWSDGAAPDARLAFVLGILARPPGGRPGAFVYSNAGYMIAGAALERATGRAWPELLRADLFGPLEMRTCGYGAPGSARSVDQPWGHDAAGKPVPPGPAADNPPGLGPAGTVHCSLADYGKFLAVHSGGGRRSLVSGGTLERLHRAESGEYAGGWIVVRGKQGAILAHSGSNTMWSATALVAPGRRLAIAVVTNQMHDRIEELLLPLLERYGGS